MKRFLLTTMIAGAVALSTSAATENFTFSYCSPAGEIKVSDLGGIGSSTAQKYGAAIKLDAPYYKGMKLKKIDAYINTDASGLRNMSDFQIFMSDSLTAGIPDIMLETVTPKAVTFAGDNLAVMSYTFEEPYVLEGNPFYIGYYLKVNRVTGPAETYPVLLDKTVTNDPDAFFYYDPTAIEKEEWSIYSYVNGAAIIYLTLERDIEQFSLGLGRPETAYAELGMEGNVIMPVVNLGSVPVSSLLYEYSLNGDIPASMLATLESPIMPGAETITYLLLPLDPVEVSGEYDMTLTVTEINDNPNQSLASSADFTLEVWPYFPQKRPLVEEFTSVKCGYCPRGYAAMEYIGEEYPDDAVVICYHNSYNGNFLDPMIVNDAMPVVNNNGLPSSCIDRTGIIDPYYGSQYPKDLGILDNLAAAMSRLPLADISISKVEVADSIISVSTDITFMKGVEDDAYRVGYVLTCNGLSNFADEWAQSNYYSGDRNFKDAPLMEQFYTARQLIYGLTYNDVPVNMTAMNGLRNSLTDISPYTAVTNGYSFDVSNIRNIYGQSLNPFLEIDRMVVNAFIVERETGMIVNACKFPVGKVYNTVEEIEADEDGVPVYYDLAGRRIDNPDRGIYIQVTGNKVRKVIK